MFTPHDFVDDQPDAMQLRRIDLRPDYRVVHARTLRASRHRRTAIARASPRMTRRWRLFPKYALLIIGLVTGMLLVSSAVGIYFSYQENRDHLVALQDEKAEGAANRIAQYVEDIEHQLSWTALPRVDPASGDALESRRIEYLKLLRQAPLSLR